MTFKLQDVIADAGTDLNDASGTRWTPADRLTYVNDGIAAAKSLRPDLFLATIAEDYEALETGDDVPLPDRYRPALLAYVKHRCLERQTDRKNLPEAAAQFKLFVETMRSL